jgi:hypothetical protein
MVIGQNGQTNTLNVVERVAVECSIKKEDATTHSKWVDPISIICHSLKCYLLFTVPQSF